MLRDRPEDEEEQPLLPLPWSHCPVCGGVLAAGSPECPSCHAVLRQPRPVPERPPPGAPPSEDAFVDFHVMAGGPGPPAPFVATARRLRMRGAPAQALGALADALISVVVTSTVLAVAALLSTGVHAALDRHLLALWLDAFLVVDLLGRGGMIALGRRTPGLRAATVELSAGVSSRLAIVLLPSPVQAALALARPLPGLDGGSDASAGDEPPKR